MTLESHNLLYGTGINRVVPGPGMLCFGTNATMFDAASINVNSTAYFPGFEATGVHGDTRCISQAAYTFVGLVWYGSMAILAFLLWYDRPVDVLGSSPRYELLLRDMEKAQIDATMEEVFVCLALGDGSGSGRAYLSSGLATVHPGEEERGGGREHGGGEEEHGEGKEHEAGETPMAEPNPMRLHAIYSGSVRRKRQRCPLAMPPEQSPP